MEGGKKSYPMNAIQTIIVSLGGSAVIALALIKWSGSLLQSKITMSWDQKNKTELEMIKANLQSNQEIVKLAVSSLTSNNQKIIDQQLIAVGDIWRHILELRRCLTPVTRYYTTLDPEQYNLPNKEDLLESLQYSRLDYIRLSQLVSEHEKLEIHRPYLGYIWGLYCLYRAFMLRLHFKFDDDLENGTILPWDSDEALIRMVRESIGSRFEQVNTASPKSISQIIIMIESEILAEIEKLISGQNSTEKNYREARRLMELASQENSSIERLETKHRIKGLA